MKRVLYLLPLLFALLFAESVEARKVKYPNGDYYVGKWKKKAPHGKGIMKYANGDVYEGWWYYGQRNYTGCMTYKSGARYEGGWLIDEKEGKGKFTSSDGSTYEGDWKKGVKHGYGTMKYSDGACYEGEWENGLPHGRGKHTSKDGTIYEGYYSSGSKDGEGKQNSPTGDSYEGTWKKGLFHSGKCSYINSKEKYEGSYVNGKLGVGRLELANGDWYEGTWKDGFFYKGKCKENTALRVFEGNYENGKPYTGTIDGRLDTNGDYYKGEMQSGNFVEGECVITKNDWKFVGRKSENKYLGRVTYNNGYIYEGALDENMRRTGEGKLSDNLSQGTLTAFFSENDIIEGNGSFIHSSTTYNFNVKKSDDGYQTTVYNAGKPCLTTTLTSSRLKIFASIAQALDEQAEKERKEKEMEESRAFCRKYLMGHVYRAEKVSWNSTDAAWLMGTILDVKVTLRFISADKAEYTINMRTTDALDDNPFVGMRFEALCNELDGTTETVDYKYMDGKLFIGDTECRTGNNLKNIHYDMELWNCWFKQIK